MGTGFESPPHGTLATITFKLRSTKLAPRSYATGCCPAKEVFGSYAEKSLNQVTVFVDAADSAILRTGCSGAQTVSSVIFDNSNSVAIL